MKEKESSTGKSDFLSLAWIECCYVTYYWCYGGPPNIQRSKKCGIVSPRNLCTHWYAGMDSRRKTTVEFYANPFTSNFHGK